jgi:hypothetical protein
MRGVLYRNPESRRRSFGNGGGGRNPYLEPVSELAGILTVTDLNDFNGPAQTTNLGVRSSNLFGRATQYSSANPE